MNRNEYFISSLSDEGRYRLLIDAVIDYAIYMLDRNGTVTSWNPGARRFKGYEESEILGEDYSRFFTPEDRASGQPRANLEIAAREGRFESEGWRVRKDGSRFWAHVVLDSIRDDTGVIVGFAKITRDVTERHNAERALERTREELFQSQKMDAIGQLTGGVAHDFNNLLMAVLGSLEIVRKRMPEDMGLLKFVDNAIEAAQRGAMLTQRMLAFARRQHLDAQPVEVGPLVEGMRSLLQSSLGPSVLIQTSLPKTLSKVSADPNQLELALLNLAVNARDAMPRGGTITIEGREDQIFNGPKAGRYVCVAIRDTGEGMDEATLMRAMEPFFTTKGIGKGTGLGLSMVHGMVEQLGGMITLRSRKDEGTTVELWLPVIDMQTSSRVDNQALNGSSAGSGSLTVLAVDDDPLVLLNTVAMLEELGHAVFEAGSAPNALELLRQNPQIDLLITDQAMPHMTGVELARAARAARPDLPIIVATGYAELPPDAPRELNRLSKPFRQQDLQDCIAALPRQKEDTRPQATEDRESCTGQDVRKFAGS